MINLIIEDIKSYNYIPLSLSVMYITGRSESMAKRIENGGGDG